MKKTVADFMVRLQGSGLFSNVELKTVKRQAVQNTNLKGFQIVCTKVVPQQPKPQNQKKPKRVKA